MTHRYRLEYETRSEEHGERMISLDVPDIVTALVVADINIAGDAAQLWDGDKPIAKLQRQRRANSGYWQVN